MTNIIAQVPPVIEVKAVSNGSDAPSAPLPEITPEKLVAIVEKVDKKYAGGSR